MADFITEIKERRVLPAVGVYAAGCWVLIEILDRLVERYLLSPYLTDMVFWGLYSLIPAVVLVAWSYGRPGKDTATTAQKVGVPINLVATVGLLVTVFGDKDFSATASLVTLPNEEGKAETHYVPSDAYRRRLAVFFFDNASGDPALDWLQYAISEMLVQDLQQDPFMSVISPWDNWGNGMYPRMREAGFEAGLDVPRSLMRQIAEDANRQFFIEGSIDRNGDEFRLTARIWDSRTLQLLDEVQRSGWDLYVATDGLSASLREALEVPDAGRMAQDLPLAETYGESEQALRHYLDGLNTRLFRNDLAAAANAYQQSVEADPNFVLGWATLATNSFEQGDMQAAQQALGRAQALDYRLPDADRALLKQMAYRLAGENGKLMAFLELQAQIRDDAVAHNRLGTMRMFTGDLEGAKQSLATAAQRDPLNTQLYLNLAVLERATDNLDGAIAYARKVHEEKPADEESLVLLGDLLRDNGQLDAAQREYAKAQLLAEPPVLPLVRLADLALRGGDTASARQLVEQADAVAAAPADRILVHNGAAQLEMRLGRVNAAISQLRALLVSAEASQPPVVIAIGVYAPIAASYLELNDFEHAREALQAGRDILQPPLDQFLAFTEALLAIRSQQLEEAEAAIERGAAIIEQFDFDPLRSQLEFMRSELLSARGEHARAAEVRGRAVESVRHSIIGNELTGQLPAFYAELARVQVDAGLLEEAERSVSEGLRLDPNNPRLWLEKARYQQASGRAQLAAASLQYALAVWQQADSDYLFYRKARDLQAELGSGAAQAAVIP